MIAGIPIWIGTGERRETRGVVVDLCAPCAALQSHWLCDLFVALQFNTLNVDRGMHSCTTVVCFRCSSETEVDDSRYAEVISQTEVANLSLADGLARTHPRLARAIGDVARARESDAPVLLIECVEALLFLRVNVERACDELARWDDLSREDRAALDARVRELWAAAGNPTRPTLPVQPGMPGWGTPSREASIVRAVDWRVAAVCLFIVAVIVTIAAVFD